MIRIITSLVRIINGLIRIYRRHINKIPMVIIMMWIFIYGSTNSIIVMKTRISRRWGPLRTLIILLLNNKSETARNHKSSGN